MTRFLRNSWTLPILLSLTTLLASPRVAYSHGGLKSSKPAAGAELSIAPKEVRLRFSEAPEIAVSRIGLTGPNGAKIALGSLKVAADNPRILIASIPSGLVVAGIYTVTWRMAGADGHPTHGSFTFTILPMATELTATSQLGDEADSVHAIPLSASSTPSAHQTVDTANAETSFNAQSPVYVVVRWFQFTALLILLGVIAFYYGVLGFVHHRKDAPQNSNSGMLPLARNRAATIGRLAGVSLIATALLRLIAQLVAMYGGADALDTNLIIAMLDRTIWGWSWMTQLVLAVVAIIGFHMARNGASNEEKAAKSRRGWALAAIATLLVAFTPAFSGHAASSQLPGLATAADGLHVIGAGGWLGSLFVLVTIGIPSAMTLDPQERGPAVADLVNAFSPTALGFAGILVSTGIFSAWLHVGTFPALWNTTYGKTLLVKLATLSIVVLLGAYNWLRMKPALGDMNSATHLKQSASMELAMGLMVLIVTAVLVGMPTAIN